MAISIIEERVMFNKTESGEYRIEALSMEELENQENDDQGKP